MRFLNKLIQLEVKLSSQLYWGGVAVHEMSQTCFLVLYIAL